MPLVRVLGGMVPKVLKEGVEKKKEFWAAFCIGDCFFGCSLMAFTERVRNHGAYLVHFFCPL